MSYILLKNSTFYQEAWLTDIIEEMEPTEYHFSSNARSLTLDNSILVFPDKTMFYMKLAETDMQNHSLVHITEEQEADIINAIRLANKSHDILKDLMEPYDQSYLTIHSIKEMENKKLMSEEIRKEVEKAYEILFKKVSDEMKNYLDNTNKIYSIVYNSLPESVFKINVEDFETPLSDMED